MDFQAISWCAKNDSEYKSRVHVFGRSETGASVHIEVPFNPWFFVRSKHGHASVVERVNRHLSGRGLVLGGCRPVSGIDFAGFKNNRRDTFTRLEFDNLWAFRNAKELFKSDKTAECFEGSVDPVLKLLHLRDLPPCGWLRADIHADKMASETEVHETVPANALRRAPEREGRPIMAPFVVCSYDIEAYSATGDFPEAGNEDDPVIQIGMTFATIGSQDTDSVLLCLGDCADIAGAEVESFDDEAEMIMRWAELLRERRVDMTLGYNTFGFDDAYLFHRLELHLRDADEEEVREGAPIPNVPFGHLEGAGGRLVTKRGMYTLEFMDMPGIFQVDLLLAIRREYNLTSYKLDSVARHFVDDQKVDLSPKAMMALWREGTPEAKAEIGVYCLHDTALPLRLAKRLDSLSALFEMANATYVPVDYILQRGQTIRCYSLLVHAMHKRGMLCPDDWHISEGDTEADAATRARADGEENKDKGKAKGYVGAVVIPPLRGAYFQPCAVLDFQSLYPSIMRAHRLCPSALVLDQRYAHVPGVDYTDIVVGSETFRFARAADAVTPELLQTLGEGRKRAKREMASAQEAGESEKAALLDAKQKAIKVSMNSLYGLFGSTQGYMPCKAVAAGTTAMGRAMIDKTKEVVEEMGGTVIYGDTDSVFVTWGPDITMEQAFQWGKEYADAVTKHFLPPIKLEFEKTFSVLLLFKKKRYVGTKFEALDGQGTFSAKGIQVVRRDVCPFVQNTFKSAIQMVLEDRAFARAKTFVLQAVEDLLRGRVSMRDLVVSKAMRADYKNDAQPHLTVAKKLVERGGEGARPRVGDRVPFVFVRGKRDAKVAELAEDPDFVAEKKLKPNYSMYLDNGLRNPLNDLFSLEDGQASASSSSAPDMFEPVVLRCKGQRVVTSYFAAK